MDRSTDDRCVGFRKSCGGSLPTIISPLPLTGTWSSPQERKDEQRGNMASIVPFASGEGVSWCRLSKAIYRPCQY